jgi:hypothetical protein
MKLEHVWFCVHVVTVVKDVCFCSNNIDLHMKSICQQSTEIDWLSSKFATCSSAEYSVGCFWLQLDLTV